jgi:dihydroxyacetone kinase
MDEDNEGDRHPRTKKLFNSVDSCVDESIAGLCSVHTGLRQLEGHRVIVRADIDDVIKAGKVTVMCGGGSGHEPAHAGAVFILTPDQIHQPIPSPITHAHTHTFSLYVIFSAPIYAIMECAL